MSNIKIVLPKKEPYPFIVENKSFKFSGGEIQVSVPAIASDAQVIIYANIRNSDDIMELLLTTNAVKKRTNNIELFMPYIPYARQDRVMNNGEALSIKVFADLINAQGYAKVTVLDAHSDVSVVLIDRCINLNKHDIFLQLFGHIKENNYAFVAPDAGAIKKTYEFAKSMNVAEVIRADKTRNVQNGEITGTIVYSENLGNKNVLIVDDICDGGRTFIELSKELRKKTSGNIDLLVTHGIFSKGLLPLRNSDINHIYTSNSWLPQDDYLSVYPFGF